MVPVTIVHFVGSSTGLKQTLVHPRNFDRPISLDRMLRSNAAVSTSIPMTDPWDGTGIFAYMNGCFFNGKLVGKFTSLMDPVRYLFGIKVIT